MSSFGENKPGNRVIVSYHGQFYGLFYCSALFSSVGFSFCNRLPATSTHTPVGKLEAYLKNQIPENFISRKNRNTLFAGPPGRIQMKEYPR